MDWKLFQSLTCILFATAFENTDTLAFFFLMGSFDRFRNGAPIEGARTLFSFVSSLTFTGVQKLSILRVASGRGLFL